MEVIKKETKLSNKISFNQTNDYSTNAYGISSHVSKNSFAVKSGIDPQKRSKIVKKNVPNTGQKSRRSGVF